jgi:hypothetical protein
VTPIAARDTAASTPTPADPPRSPTDQDEPTGTPRASRWQRLSTAVAESHRAAVPF